MVTSSTPCSSSLHFTLTVLVFLGEIFFPPPPTQQWEPLEERGGGGGGGGVEGIRNLLHIAYARPQLRNLV